MRTYDVIALRLKVFAIPLTYLCHTLILALWYVILFISKVFIKVLPYHCKGIHIPLIEIDIDIEIGIERSMHRLAPHKKPRGASEPYLNISSHMLAFGFTRKHREIGRFIVSHIFQTGFREHYRIYNIPHVSRGKLLILYVSPKRTENVRDSMLFSDQKIEKREHQVAQRTISEKVCTSGSTLDISLGARRNMVNQLAVENVSELTNHHVRVLELILRLENPLLTLNPYIEPYLALGCSLTPEYQSRVLTFMMGCSPMSKLSRGRIIEIGGVV